MNLLYKIRNWKRFQHFKDRLPPWIKLHKSLLDDPDWHELSGDDAKTLIGLWIIASEDETRVGLLPDTRKISFRVRKSEEEVLETLTRLNGWMESIDINTISERYQVVPDTSSLNLDSKGSNKRFIKPDLEDLRSYCRERANNVDPQSFIDFYESKGWKVGQTPMKDWKAAVRTWEKRDGGKQAPPLPKTCDFEKCERPGTNHHFGRHYCKAHLPL